MSYTIDIYRREIKPIHNFLDFALFVSFFPQLVAGPIERAKNLLPQLTRSRTIDAEKVSEGAYLILWGYFKKVVIADNLAYIVDYGFGNIEMLNGLTALIVIYAFAWQIYCDFSGYTDIARGSALCLGINLRINFNLPYLSIDPSDFWRRWHISLSSWFRDYLYIPLGGNRHGKFNTYRNLLITMVLCGLWHGAGWPFVIWGLYHGLLMLFYRAFQEKVPFDVPKYLKIIFLFHLVCVGWVFFRAGSLGDAVQFLVAFARIPEGVSVPKFHYIVLIIPLFMVQIFQYLKDDHFVIFTINPVLRVTAYFCLYLAVVTIGRWEMASFIYFQF